MWKTLAALCIMVLLGACSSLRGAPDWPHDQTLESLDPIYASYVHRSFLSRDEATRVGIRNEYITVRLALIDRNYNAYREGLYSQRVGSSVAFDLAALGLTAGGAASSSVAAKTNSSALAAALIGSKASIDKNVYFDRTLPALLSQMEGSRAEVRALLFAGMILPSDRYQLAEADAHLISYRDAGSLVGAVKSLTTQAAQTEIRAEATLRARLPSEDEITLELERRKFAVTKAAYSDSALTVQKCVRPDGTVRPDVKQPLEQWFSVEHPKWVTRQPHGAVSPTITPFNDFLTDSAYESLRKQALADASLRSVFQICAET